ncbi:GNAT family N-acetyltransferase [Brevibacillus laterosporus]|uniref:GNAT family N-acetyltransferase n=1 Tax=Brevibacillus laterosporus TaxID=1465 RepID=UPI00112AD3E3|nr:GNAT family N-acetyltransferase [Brevibacillus laterosporus]MBG9801538.1 acetyltransferase [Brevibacillus laterosporus]TPH19037.1 GNAT family N-acetyltransferase [Brevibacillus laterosporus]
MPGIHFRRINAQIVLEICNLSDTLSHAQRAMVADNAVSIAQAYFSENAWFRAIYTDDNAIGFIMLHQGSDYDDEIDVHGVYLWRFMIAGPYQGKGYGKQAIEVLAKHLKGQGINEITTSCESGEGSPMSFYTRLGFTPNGETFGEEIGLTLRF